MAPVQRIGPNLGGRASPRAAGHFGSPHGSRGRSPSHCDALLRSIHAKKRQRAYHHGELGADLELDGDGAEFVAEGEVEEDIVEGFGVSGRGCREALCRGVLELGVSRSPLRLPTPNIGSSLTMHSGSPPRLVMYSMELGRNSLARGFIILREKKFAHGSRRRCRAEAGPDAVEAFLAVPFDVIHRKLHAG